VVSASVESNRTLADVADASDTVVVAADTVAAVADVADVVVVAITWASVVRSCAQYKAS
jgi:hypothetical protein